MGGVLGMNMFVRTFIVRSRGDAYAPSRDFVSPHDTSSRAAWTMRACPRVVLRFVFGCARAIRHAGGIAPQRAHDRGSDPGYVPSDTVELDPAYRHQPVYYRTHEPPGTIIIDTSDRFLYFIQPNNVAIRYGIGVGRDGFQWQGLLKVSRKAEWPDWTPPPEMIQRQPYLPRFMAGGPGNPMGARALYLGNTVYRIHGPNAPETIGQAVSSGCFP